jgi:hypothetical protein
MGTPLGVLLGGGYLTGFDPFQARPQFFGAGEGGGGLTKGNRH